MGNRQIYYLRIRLCGFKSECSFLTDKFHLFCWNVNSQFNKLEVENGKIAEMLYFSHTNTLLLSIGIAIFSHQFFSFLGK